MYCLRLRSGEWATNIGSLALSFGYGNYTYCVYDIIGELMKTPSKKTLKKKCDVLLGMKGDIKHLKGDDHRSKLCPTINEIIERVKEQQTRIEELEDRIRRHLLNDSCKYEAR